MIYLILYLVIAIVIWFILYYGCCSYYSKWISTVTSIYNRLSFNEFMSKHDAYDKLFIVSTFWIISIPVLLIGSIFHIIIKCINKKFGIK